MTGDETALTIFILFMVAIVLSLIVIAVNMHMTRRTIQRFLFPEGVPEVLRACPHCRRQMPALATVCSVCGRESEQWIFEGGRWSKIDDSGTRVYLDAQTRRWAEEPAPDA